MVGNAAQLEEELRVVEELSVESLVTGLVETGGSDLHLKVGSAPATRVNGRLTYLEGYESLLPAGTEELLQSIIPEASAAEFEADGEADFSYAVSGVGRFRVNAFRQRGSVSIVMRFIPFGVPNFDDLKPAGGHPDARQGRTRDRPGYRHYR